MKSLFYTALFLSFFAGNVKAQTLTIEECYQLSTSNYPLIKQYELIDKTKGYTLSNANKAYLPQVSLTAIEGYVFGDFPSMGTGSESKFKFIGLAQVNQSIWDGGMIKNQKAIINSSSEVEKASIKVSLYEINSRVNQLYFGILLIDEQLKQLEIQNSILSNNIDKVKKLFDNGLTYKTDVDEMKVEQLKIKQQQKEYLYTRNGYETMLSYLIGKKINKETKLEKPLVSNSMVNNSINRPELKLYENQRNLIDAQAGTQKASLMPKIGLLAAGVVFAPGISLGPTEMSNVGVAGLNLSWNVNALYKNGNEKQLTKQQLNKVNVQEETFLFNTKLEMNQKTADIERQKAILIDDDEIVKLRQTIREGYQLKYDTGAGPLIDLLNAAQKESESRNQKVLHEMQLLMSIYEYQTISGN